MAAMFFRVNPTYGVLPYSIIVAVNVFCPQSVWLNLFVHKVSSAQRFHCISAISPNDCVFQESSSTFLQVLQHLLLFPTGCCEFLQPFLEMQGHYSSFLWTDF